MYVYLYSIIKVNQTPLIVLNALGEAITDTKKQVTKGRKVEHCFHCLQATHSKDG